jgi:HMG (high mobility group) box
MDPCTHMEGLDEPNKEPSHSVTFAMTSPRDTSAVLSSAFRQLSDALHMASVACKDLEYTIPLLVAARPSNLPLPAPSAESTARETQPPIHRAKRVKDPNEPKRPPSSYLLFQKDARKILAHSNPDLKSSEAVTKIATMWRELSEDEKQVHFLLSTDADYDSRFRSRPRNSRRHICGNETDMSKRTLTWQGKNDE